MLGATANVFYGPPDEQRAVLRTGRPPHYQDGNLTTIYVGDGFGAAFSAFIMPGIPYHIVKNRQC
jgi:hypothetical protein